MSRLDPTSSTTPQNLTERCLWASVSSFFRAVAAGVDALAAGDAGELDAFDDLLHPDAVIHAPLGLSTMSAEAEKAVWRDALAAMSTYATSSRRSCGRRRRDGPRRHPAHCFIEGVVLPFIIG